MSSLKSELMRIAADDIGNRLDDLKDRAEASIHESVGAKRMADLLASDVSALFAHIQKDVDAGAYDVEVAKLIRTYVDRARQIAINHSKRQEVERFMAMGRVSAMAESVKHVKSVHDKHQQDRDVAIAAEEEAKAQGFDAPREARLKPSPKQRAAMDAEAEAKTEPAVVHEGIQGDASGDAVVDVIVTEKPAQQEGPKKGRRKK
jgi:hypothetical protein